MSNARNHHYISQFYLRGFTKSGKSKEKIFVFDKHEQSFFASNPKNVGSKRDFNRISLEGKENILEEQLAELEGVLAPIFKKTIDIRKFPNDEDLYGILKFISMLAIKNPVVRHQFDDFWKTIADRFMTMTLMSEERYLDQCRQAGIPEEKIVPYEQEKEFFNDKTRYTIDVNQEIHAFGESGVIEHLTNLLCHRNWFLLVTNDDNTEFITSDFPVSLTSKNKRTGIQGVGFGHSDSEVFFPLSKNLALLGVFEESEHDKVIYVPEKNVTMLNKMTYAFSNRQIYGSKKSFLNNVI
ncbi:MAG: DUF4238 domain-containing protein [Bacteriovoracaceae bacterium]